MKKHLKNAAKTLEKGRRRTYISRVAWGDLYELVSTEYKQLDDLNVQKSELGNLYLSNNTKYPPLNNKRSRFSNIMNQIQISSGWRHLNVTGINNDDKEHPKAEVLAESGATLWYSQDITGAVSVYVAPYNSRVMTVDEKDIIIARYSCPTKISKKNVQQHFSTYFKYCAVTSVHGNLSFISYIYRLWLQLNNRRIASEIRRKKSSFIEIFLIIAGIFATLYAGNKMFT
jgi:hypothetical protein